MDQTIVKQTHIKLTKKQKDFIINSSVLKIAEGIKPKLVKQSIRQDFGVSVPIVNQLYKQAQQIYFEGVRLLSKEDYLKDSVEKLENYEEKAGEILSEAMDKGKLKEATLALKEGRESLNDRNELLGITKGTTAIQINFESTNFSEKQFLDVYNNNRKSNDAPEIVEVEPIEEEELKEVNEDVKLESSSSSDPSGQ